MPDASRRAAIRFHHGAANPPNSLFTCVNGRVQ